MGLVSIYLARWKAAVEPPVYLLLGIEQWKYGWSHVAATDPDSAAIQAKNKVLHDLSRAGFKVSEVIILETERL